MFKLVVVSVLLVVAYGAPKINSALPTLDGRIVGGEAVDIEDFPYQLSLLSFGIHICGASLISSTFAVTAAHCTFLSSPSFLSIRAGSSNLYDEGQVVRVKRINEHPLYNPLTIDYDISVLELDSEVIFGAAVSPITLPHYGESIFPGETCIVSGWGALYEGGLSSPQLQAVQVRSISNKDCASAYGGSITDRMMCAGVPEGGKDACQGDSGGPLVINGELIGIVSWGYGCGRPSYPGVYASVPNLRRYINEVSGI